jgi:hypothetical protein
MYSSVSNGFAVAPFDFTLADCGAVAADWALDGSKATTVGGAIGGCAP